ncbi:hypothetical protein [Parapedobacter lycopersici]|uniref:hypothetical protein n=1 Tax=Parapedobacter lycopersici TaxID=1864939 RepID=UPI00334264B6
MKKLVIYVVAIVFGIMSFSDAYAQRGRGHGRGNGKEHPKYRHERGGHHYANGGHYRVREYDGRRGNSYREYYRERDKAYRKYVKQRGKRYRDHDAWYYGPRFYHRSEYVYFPAYHTYYDPYRRGYVYRQHNAWVFAQAMPSFMVGLNLGSVNVQFMANLPM